MAQDRARGHDIAESEAHGADDPSLPAQKDGGLVEHYTPGDISQQGRRCFVRVRREIEVNVGAAHFGVIAAAGPAGHQAVAEIDQAAQRDKGKEDGLFQADAVGAACFLLQEAAFPDVRAHPQICLVQENRFAEESSLQLDTLPELAVLDRRGRFVSQFAVGRDDGFPAVNPASGIDRCAFFRNLIDIDVVADVQRCRVGNVYPFIQQLLNFFMGFRLKIHTCPHPGSNDSIVQRIVFSLLAYEPCPRRERARPFPTFRSSLLTTHHGSTSSP